MADLDFTFRDASGVIQTALSTNDGTGKHIPKHEFTAGEAHVGKVGGQLVQKFSTFTRPANTTAYAVGDIVGTASPVVNTVAGLARVAAGSGYITGVRLTTDKKSITPRIRIHFYNDVSVTVAADNAAFESLYAEDTLSIGTVTLGAMTTPADTTNSDMSSAEDMTIRIPFVCEGGVLDIYYALETLDVFTPASGEHFRLTVFGDLN